MDANKLLSQLDCKYGAPMGRRTITDDTNSKVRLFRIRMVDGAYDVGGAYWGMGTPIYCALGDGFQVFRRAKTRDEVKKELKTEFPSLRFYR
jgi:hypothetical protein